MGSNQSIKEGGSGRTSATPAPAARDSRIPEMEFTGERYAPGIKGKIEYEHKHRYGFAAGLVRDRVVVDIACGEGYGSAMLAEGAKRVIGVDVDEAAVAHAGKRYGHLSNLVFKTGDCRRIPCEDKSADAVVSFETLEQIMEQGVFLREIKRVLRPGGVVLISSPNKAVYSDIAGFENPYHKKELDIEEFRKLLKAHFRTVRFWGQRLTFSSFVWPMDVQKSVLLVHSGPGKDGESVRFGPPYEPEYVLAVCSDSDTGIPDQASLWTSPEDDLYILHSEMQGRAVVLCRKLSVLDRRIRFQKHRLGRSIGSLFGLRKGGEKSKNDGGKDPVSL